MRWLEDQAGNGHAPALFDLITACDCLEYFGDLRRVVQVCGVCGSGRVGGSASTVECGESYPHTLMEIWLPITHHELAHPRGRLGLLELEVRRCLKRGFCAKRPWCAGHRAVRGAAQAGSVSATPIHLTSTPRAPLGWVWVIRRFFMPEFGVSA